MSTYKKLKEKKQTLHYEACREVGKLDFISEDAKKTADIVKNAQIIISDIDKQFDMATQLTGVDKQFLFTAVALQCIRQYVIGTLTQRKAHDESDELAHTIQDKVFGNDRQNESGATYQEKVQIYRDNGARYRATTEEIMYSLSVPYDVTKGTKEFGVGGINENGKLIGLSGTTHRYKTLGHDPLFGWVFGTANIMTNTLTNNIGLTFHVKNSQVVSHGGYDKTTIMLEYFRSRSNENKKDLGICLIKQGLHIMSDVYSKEGIVLPGTLKMDEQYAKRLSEYGFDFGNIIKVSAQAGFSVLINEIIAMVHALLYDESREMSWNMYSVRTRKILMYSNLIATSSNVIAVACGAIAGAATGNEALVEKSLNYLDIGGMVVTIHRIISDEKFIYEVKKEFLEKEWYDLVINGGDI